MSVEKILENKIIKGSLMKIAKKAFKDDGLTMLAVTLDERGELTVKPYNEPVVIITAADKAKYDNLLLQKLNDNRD